MRLQSNALVLATEARNPQPKSLPSVIVGLEVVLVSEGFGYETGLVHLHALALEKLARILLPLLRPLLSLRATLLCVLSPPLRKSLSEHCKAVAVACTHPKSVRQIDVATVNNEISWCCNIASAHPEKKLLLLNATTPVACNDTELQCKDTGWMSITTEIHVCA